jgi:23S rRNA pseudouridine1911/1915/1917 synthase
LVQRLPGLTRGDARRLLRRGRVQVQGAPAAKGRRLVAGERVRLPACSASTAPLPRPDLPLELLLVRPELVLINKPPGQPCHPLTPGESETVANALAARHPECVSAGPDPREGGLVHRLDRGTSGALLAARTPEAHAALRADFSASRVQKQYLALVDGALEQAGRVAGDLRPRPGQRGLVRLSPPPPAPGCAASSYRPLRRLGRYTLVRVDCSTGQRHQVRAHLAHAGFPVAGDPDYGGSPLPGAGGPFLHASRLLLPDGRGEFYAPLPRGRQRLLDRLEGECEPR